MNALEQRIEHFLNETISEEDLRILGNDVQENERSRERFLQEMHVQGVVSAALLSDDQRRTLVEVVQRATGGTLDASSFRDKVMHELAGQPRRKRSIDLRFILALAAVAAIALVIGALWGNRPLREAAIAKVDQAGFGIERERNGQAVALTSGMEINERDLIRVPMGTEAAHLRYPDGTTATISNGGIVRIGSQAGSKYLYVSSGKLELDVQPQAADHSLIVATPSAKAIVIGTQLAVTVTPDATHLKVFEGIVNFCSLSEGRGLVSAGESAVARAAGGTLTIKRRVVTPSALLQERFNEWRAHSGNLMKDSSLVAYYTFEDDESLARLTNHAGAFRPPSGYPVNLDGQIRNCDWSTGRFPQLKKALLFHQLGFVACGDDPAFDLQDAISVMMWFRVREFTVAHQALVTKGDGSWRLQRHADTNQLVFACSGLKEPEVVTQHAVNDNQWHLATGTYDGKRLAIYLDGKLEAEALTTGRIARNYKSVLIGANSSASYRDFQGWIDEVGIWNRALTRDEIDRIYRAGKPISSEVSILDR